MAQGGTVLQMAHTGWCAARCNAGRVMALPCTNTNKCVVRNCGAMFYLY